MTEHTTIQVTEEQRDRLKELPGESYRETIDQLLQTYNSDSSPGPVTLEPTEYKRIADELEDRLRH